VYCNGSIVYIRLPIGPQLSLYNGGFLGFPCSISSKFVGQPHFLFGQLPIGRSCVLGLHYCVYSYNLYGLVAIPVMYLEHSKQAKGEGSSRVFRSLTCYARYATFHIYILRFFRTLARCAGPIKFVSPGSVFGSQRAGLGTRPCPNGDDAHGGISDRS